MNMCMSLCTLPVRAFLKTSMYVKAYLDLSLKSLVFLWLFASWPVRLGAWPFFLLAGQLVNVTWSC